MMSWSPTANREAVNALAALWTRPEWRTSTYAPAIQDTLRTMIDHLDEVNRLRAAQVIRLLAEDDESALELVRDRLLAEQHPHVAARLLKQLRTFSDTHPAAVDDLVARLSHAQPWEHLLAITERDPDLRDPLSVFVHLVLYLAIRHQTPAAAQLAQEWFTNPTRTEAAEQAVASLRDWLALPPERGNERTRAFGLLNLAITVLIKLTDSESNTDLLRSALKSADTIAHNLYFASGAHDDNGESPKLPDPEFADHALSTIRLFSKFKHPSTVHKIIETLNHLSPLAPRQVFLIVSETISTGDRYTYDQLAADEIATLIERYLAEFREVVVKDPELLSAIRSVLHAFVDVGWPSAINLTYHLNDAFR